MLEAVTLRGEPTALPTLCEALVYYREVHIAGGVGVFLRVVNELGEDNFRRLIERGVLKIDLAQWDHAVFGNQPFPASCRLVEIAAGRPNQAFHDTLVELNNNPNRVGQKISRNTLQLISDHITDLGKPPSVISSTADELSNQRYVTTLVSEVVDSLVPNYILPPNFYAKAFVFGNEAAIVTNLDYDSLNRAYHAIVPPEQGGVIDQARLLASAPIPHALMYYVGDSGTDVWVEELSGRLLRTRVESYARRLSQGERTVSNFEEIMFEGRSFRGAIKSGSRTVEELVSFLEEENTIRFKKMIADSRNGSELIREYDRALLSEHSWMKSTPAKAIKLALFTGIAIASGGIPGAVAAAVPGAIASTIDEFAISKLRLGWRPNQWVDRTARPFLFAG